MANSFGFNAPATQQGVFELPLTGSLGPANVLVLTTETLIADLTGLVSDHGVLAVENRGPNPVHYAFNNDGAAGPGVTLLNGPAIAAGGTLIVDKPGGLALWGISLAAQVAPADTRVSAARR